MERKNLAEPVHLMRFQLAIAVLLAVFSSHSAAQWEPWSLRAGASVAHDDNMNIASRGSDKESDEFAEVSVALGRRYTFRESAGGGTRFSWQADLSKREHNDFDGLSHVGAGGGIRLDHKLGLGPRAIRINASASSHYRDTDDRYREAWYSRAGIGVSRRFTNRLDAGLSAGLRRQRGEEFATITPTISSEVYDQDRYELGAHVRYTLTPWLRPGLAIDYIDGEFDSRCGASTPEEFEQLAQLAEVKSLAIDDTFGGCRWLLDGDGYQVRLTADIRAARNHNLQLLWSYRDIELDNNASYETNVYRLSYRYRFR